MNVVEAFIVLSKAILTAFLYSLTMFWLVILAMLPFIFTTFIPKIKRALLKNRSTMYWIIYGFISCIIYFAASLMAFLFKLDIYFIYLVLLWAVIFNIYSTLYLLLFKLFSHSKQNTFLNKKEKYYLLGLNALFALLLPAIVLIVCFFW